MVLKTSTGVQNVKHTCTYLLEKVAVVGVAVAAAGLLLQTVE